MGLGHVLERALRDRGGHLAERLDRGFHAFPECRANIARPPSDYLKQFYYDTVNFDPAALELAIAFAGADHVLAGILGDNAARLLPPPD